MERNLPGVFNAAGLMVPDPSISAAPIPFIDDVAGIGGAEYMVSGGRKLVVAYNVAPTAPVRASARSRCAVDGDDDYCNVSVVCDDLWLWRESSHAGRARK